MNEPLKTNGNCMDCKHCLIKNSLFRLLTSEELDLLNNTRVEVNFNKGEIIYKQGMPLTHLVIIHTGFGKIYIESSRGRNLILGYAKAFDLNGGIGVFIDQKHHSSLMAVNDCSTCFIDVDAFNKVLKSNFEFMRAYLKEYSLRVQQTYHQFAVLTQKNMEGRMAESILYLNDSVFRNGYVHSVSRSDLAEFTAMSKESAIRVLKEFKDEKYIEVIGDDIKILDEESLRKIAMHG